MTPLGFPEKYAQKYCRIPAVQRQIPLQEVRPCPLCNKNDEEELFKLDDFQFFNDQEGENRALHRIVACTNCGFLFTNPAYTAEGFRVLFEKAGQSYGCSRGRTEEQVEWLTGHVPHATSFLDIGCGSGDFLKALPENSKKIGLDIDEITINKNKKENPDIFFETIDFETKLSIPKTDVITLLHVLEHLSNPVQFLENLYAGVEENTKLFIEVPVIEHEVNISDSNIIGFFTIQHLSHFSGSSLHAMLQKCGWGIVVYEEMNEYNGYRIVVQKCSQEFNKNEVFEIRKSRTDQNTAEKYLQHWQENITSVQNKLAAIKGEETVILWGAGQHTEYLDKLTDIFLRASKYLIIDKDPLKKGTTFHGIPTIQPDKVPEGVWRNGKEKIVISSFARQTDIREWLYQGGVKKERVIVLYNETMRY